MLTTFTDERHPGLDIVHCETDADLVILREQHEEFHEGALSLLRYPSHVVGFLSHEPPKSLGAMGFRTPIRIGKDEAGNFSFIDLD